jgi:diacylglycerol kinase (ATP)
VNVLLVFNPHAGSGRARRLLPDIQEALARQGIHSDLLASACRGDAIEQMATRALGSFDAVIAAGGDGTVFEVLNGLYRQDRGQRIPLGVIPIGTGNAFARDLGLMPGDWRKGVEIIAGGKQREVDVGRVSMPDDQFHFLNIVGMGFAVDAGLTAASLKPLGSIAYTLGVLWQVLKFKSYSLHLEIDGEIIEQDNVFVEVSNTRFTGTTFLIAPGAEMDDGLLDVTLLQRLPRLRLLRLFPTIYSGRHVDFEEITVHKGSHIRILGPHAYPLAADGEFRGATPATITCLHRDLTVFTS